MRRTAPVPVGARTPAEFLAVMRELQRWSGLSLDELEARTANVPVFVPGGLNALLAGDALPPRELVSAFIGACGCVPEVQAEWMSAYERVATGKTDPLLPPEKPAVVEPPVPSLPEEKDESQEQPKQHRPRHRKPSRKSSWTSRIPLGGPANGALSTGGEPRERRRSLTPLVAAPAFVTAGVIAIAMVSGPAGDTGENGNEKTREGELSAAAPPSTGWYSIQPENAESVGNCLTILPDDQFEPTLSQDRCDEEDSQQRFRVETRPDGTYVLKAFTNKSELRCLMLDAPTDGARLHLSACEKKNKAQRFHLESAKPQGRPAEDGGTSKPAPLFLLKPSETRQDGMCVGIDFSHPGSVQAVHTECGKSAIWGYSFVPTAAATGF
ncbi:MAG TPA: hypothetical protein VIL71_21765 [Spirillospora sp.]